LAKKRAKGKKKKKRKEKGNAPDEDTFDGYYLRLKSTLAFIFTINL
jgi:hypothetical protein